MISLTLAHRSTKT